MKIKIFWVLKNHLNFWMLQIWNIFKVKPQLIFIEIPKYSWVTIILTTHQMLSVRKIRPPVLWSLKVKFSYFISNKKYCFNLKQWVPSAKKNYRNCLFYFICYALFRQLLSYFFQIFPGQQFQIFINFIITNLVMTNIWKR